MDISYRVIRSNRRTVAIQISPSGEVVVRCPHRMPQVAVHAFVENKSDWIEKHLEKLIPVQPFSPTQLQDLARQAKPVLVERTAYFAKVMGLTYERITIRAQHTRWGSCSGKGNLNFNCLLMLVPEQVRDYVVVHELCHLRQMNHSPEFWAEVEKVFPNYRVARKWLKDNGRGLVARLPK